MTYKFGAFEFDATANLLRKNGRTQPLEPQPGRALALLLERADEVVSKEDLRRALWGDDTHVDFDRGLAYCLSQVRAALGDSGDNPRFVQTLPRRGYRFVAPVHRLAEAPASDVEPSFDARLESWRKRLASPRILVLITAIELIAGAAVFWWFTRPDSHETPRHIVAVSIFDNETGSAEYDPLVSGLSDLVVTRLTALDPIRLGVVGNAAVLRQPRNIRNLKAVAEGVKADYVVLGQLQLADNGLRFITHLIRLGDETHLRANRIQLPGGNVSGLEAAVVAEFERAAREHVLR
ncbi:MAG: winged helix-turn-helix domain-containing protein [Vicinamibacterales bacterium]